MRRGGREQRQQQRRTTDERIAHTRHVDHLSPLTPPSSTGADPSELYTFHDVYGVDAEMLSMVPAPVLAVLLLFPISEASEAHKEEEKAKIVATGDATQKVSEKLYYMKQTVGRRSRTHDAHMILSGRHAEESAGSSIPPVCLILIRLSGWQRMWHCRPHTRRTQLGGQAAAE